MKDQFTYSQYNKNHIRHTVLAYAVKILTQKRSDAACVPRDYLRNVYDYFVLNEDENKDKIEVSSIDKRYILDWELLHDSCLGAKKPSDLTVCYLCGPEPNNDFEELINLGVLPQNIWAFEEKRNVYNVALKTYSYGEFAQPRIIKQNIQTFFAQTPKKFDIIYIDACGAIPSDQHALKCITNAFLFHRLHSPGIVISNFAKPSDKKPYTELLAQYLLSKERCPFIFNSELNMLVGKEYTSICSKIEENFEKFYGDFVSFVLRDIPSLIVPMQRFWKNPFIEQIFSSKNDIARSCIDEELIQCAREMSIPRFFITQQFLKQKGFDDEKISLFMNEIGDQNDLMNSLKGLVLLKSGKIGLQKEIIEIKDYFDNPENLYRFLDKPNSNLFFDLAINQITYPFHCNTSATKRYVYNAKSTDMFTDITVYDECRYIYDWMPALHQVKSAFSNHSWQYTFRFALDGLIKSRQNYNNEFFFQGSVVPNSEPGFLSSSLPQRERVGDSL